MKQPYTPDFLPIRKDAINPMEFLEELIDAVSQLEVYKVKLKDSKRICSLLLPVFQIKEALASAKIEGTEATLEDVLENDTESVKESRKNNEIRNYSNALSYGARQMARGQISHELFYDLHRILMEGDVRKPKCIGEYRTTQNYVCRNDEKRTITYIPPASEYVMPLMDNLIEYMLEPKDLHRALVRAAIIHFQFESIHPFYDGNGRLGRLLIPLYLFYADLFVLPYFNISESLVQDRFRYYTMLNEVRTHNDWNGWIKYFLQAAKNQCTKSISLLDSIVLLHEKQQHEAKNLMNSSNMTSIVDATFQHPIFQTSLLVSELKISSATVNRYINMLCEAKIIFSNGKTRNRTFYNSALLDLIR